MTIISDNRAENAFFEKFEDDYRRLPSHQRNRFLNDAKQAFEDRANKIRDKVSEVEEGQALEYKHGIEHGIEHTPFIKAFKR